jgi:hypothetical protein
MYHDDGYVVHGVAVSISSWDGMIDAEHGIDIDTLTIGMTARLWDGTAYTHGMALYIYTLAVTQEVTANGIEYILQPFD